MRTDLIQTLIAELTPFDAAAIRAANRQHQLTLDEFDALSEGLVFKQLAANDAAHDAQTAPTPEETQPMAQITTITGTTITPAAFLAHAIELARQNMQHGADAHQAARAALDEAHTNLSQQTFFATLDALGGQQAALAQIEQALLTAGLDPAPRSTTMATYTSPRDLRTALESAHYDWHQVLTPAQLDRALPADMWSGHTTLRSWLAESTQDADGARWRVNPVFAVITAPGQ